MSAADKFWTPATSEPFELFTYEGQVKASRVLTEGLKNRDPRIGPYRRAMKRSALYALALCAAVIAAVAAVLALIG